MKSIPDLAFGKPSLSLCSTSLEHFLSGDYLCLIFLVECPCSDAQGYTSDEAHGSGSLSFFPLCIFLYELGVSGWIFTMVY